MPERSSEKAQFYDGIMVTLFDSVYGAIEQFGLGTVTVLEMNGRGDRSFTDGDYAEFYYNDEPGRVHHVDVGVLSHAFTLINGNGEIKHLGDKSRNSYRAAYRSNDAGEIDAEGAANILEIGLFGEVVY